MATLLKSAGHQVLVLDLAASGFHEVHSLSKYLEPLLECMACLPSEERVILVGVSMGGVSISVAMERLPKKVSVAVYAAALKTGPDLNSKRRGLGGLLLWSHLLCLMDVAVWRGQCQYWPFLFKPRGSQSMARATRALGGE